MRLGLEEAFQARDPSPGTHTVSGVKWTPVVRNVAALTLASVKHYSVSRRELLPSLFPGRILGGDGGGGSRGPRSKLGLQFILGSQCLAQAFNPDLQENMDSGLTGFALERGRGWAIPSLVAVTQVPLGEAGD